MDLESQGTGNFFSLRAAVLGLWVPCVVGKTEYSFLLVSVTSYVTKTLAIILACLLAYQDTVPQGTFLLHCIPYSEKMKLFRAYVYDLLETHYSNLGFSQEDENEDPMKTLSRISADEAMCQLDYQDCVQNANDYYEESWIPFGPVPGDKIPADIIDVF